MHATDEPDERPTIPTAELLSDEERRRVMVEWGQSAMKLDDAPLPLVHQAVARHAVRAPDAPAVGSGGERITYRELDRRANRLAHHLRGMGIGLERRVVLMIERSVDLVVAMLGAFKSGGAFVPLDPALPPDRLAYILGDSGASVVLTRLASDPAPATAARVVSLEEVWRGAQSDTAPEEVDGQHPESLAYVIYTSGSTGKPKGVEVAHRTLSRLADTHRRTFAVTAADCFSQVAPSVFDASVFEIWPCLAAGASLAIIADDVARVPADMWRELKGQGVTIAFVPTPLAEALIEADVPRGVKLRLMLTAGDRLRRRPRGWTFPLYNLYGPTENTVWATTSRVEEMGDRLPPIGRPVRHTRVYVLDADLRPTPIGVPGELYLGGSSVARGYGGRPSLTAERFVPDPFAPDSGTRMYRTGDLVAWLPDGELNFIGRIDHQVKIRGIRIELGEIESALTASPAVADCAVVARESSTGDKQLIAYVVLASATVFDAELLRAHLGSTLPDYMVPSVFVEMAQMPMSPSGKVDRNALPPPPVRNSVSTPPSTLAEKLVVKSWCEALKLEHIGLEDNFFALGGHSLLAQKIVSYLSHELQANISISVLLLNPTPATMIDAIAIIYGDRETLELAAAILSGE
jgi:amino acid adenylation domain-containing protein